MSVPADTGDTTTEAALRAGADRPPSSRRALILAVLAVLLVGVNMRPAIVAVSPLLDDIRHTTGVSLGAIGALSTLPLICFGIFAPLAPRLTRSLGFERALAAVLLVLLGGVALRLVPALFPLFAGTFLVGTAVAVANVVVTALIKRDFGRHVGLMSGLHSTMLVGGGAVAAAVTVPLRDGLSLSWPGGLALWGIPVLAALAVWLPRSARSARSARSGRSARSVRRSQPSSPYGGGARVWRDRLAWAVALFYAFQSLIYYTSTTWLPSFYVAHGYSESAAGVLLAVCMGAAVVTSLVVPVWAQRSRRQSLLALSGSALCAAAACGLIVAPTGAAVLWAVLLGLGLGAVLSLGIAYMSMRARGARDAGLLSAMSQCVGYLTAAAGPTLFGLAREVTGSWTAGLAGLAVLAVPMALAGAAAGRGGHVGGHVGGPVGGAVADS